MTATALRRTIRRCTAVLVAVLALLTTEFVYWMGFQGTPSIVPSIVPLAILVVATLYLLGSLGDSLLESVE